MKRASRYLLPLLVAVAVVLAWIGLRLRIEAHAPERTFLLPSPGEILHAVGTEGGDLFDATLNTLAPALLGFAVATLLSVLFAILLAISPLLRATFFPYLMALQMTPIIVITPILLLWIGAGLASVTIITFLISFFPLVVNTTQGMISTDQNLVELFRLNKASRWQEIWRLRLPAALPYFLTGLRISAILAPIGAVTGDFFTGNSAGGVGGLGFRTAIYSAHLKTAALFATAGICCLLGFLLVSLVYFASWACLHRWHDSFERER